MKFIVNLEPELMSLTEVLLVYADVPECCIRALSCLEGTHPSSVPRQINILKIPRLRCVGTYTVLTADLFLKDMLEVVY
jgi:hypothetical protein